MCTVLYATPVKESDAVPVPGMPHSGHQCCKGMDHSIGPEGSCRNYLRTLCPCPAKAEMGEDPTPKEALT